MFESLQSDEDELRVAYTFYIDSIFVFKKKKPLTVNWIKQLELARNATPYTCLGFPSCETKEKRKEE